MRGGARLSGKFKLRGSASRAVRVPSYTGLFYSGPADKGNPNLKPESPTQYEAGLDAYFRPNLHSSLTVFHRRDTNVIDYVRASPTDLWQATNFDKLHFTGVEAATAYEPVPGQRIGVSYAALHGVNSGSTVLL